MRTTPRSRVAVASLACATTLILAVPSSAVAAPYTNDAVVTVSTTNPAIGATITITVTGFAPFEVIDLVLHSTPVPLATVTADSNGSATTTVTLPANFRCEHYITATGRTSGEVARTDLLIGPASACPSGSGNAGSGNVGNGNSGHGNVGDNNSGHGNVGNNNSGHGNVGGGSSPYSGSNYRYSVDNDFGTVGFSSPATKTDTSGASTTTALVLGLATACGIALVRRRRPSA